MPKELHKWGMKAWVLEDAANGYEWNCKLYTGKEDESLLLAWLTRWYLITLMMTGSKTKGTMSTWITSTPALQCLETCVKKDLRHAEQSGQIDKEYMTSGQQS